MSKACEYADGCPMFRYFRRAAQEAYREAYCMGSREMCARRKLILSGKPVPDNLLPHGGKLWNDGEPPPDRWR